MKQKQKLNKTQLLTRRADAAILLASMELGGFKTHAEIEASRVIAQAKRLLAQKSVNLSQHVSKIQRAWETHCRMKRVANGDEPWLDGTTAMAWAQEVMDDQIIVAHGGKLWAVPYEMDSDEKVTFGKPQRVKVEYQEVAGAPAIKTITAQQALTAAKKIAPDADSEVLAWIGAQLMVSDGFTNLICNMKLPHLPCNAVVT